MSVKDVGIYGYQEKTNCLEYVLNANRHIGTRKGDNMINDKCAFCGAVNNLQVHHWLYMGDPEDQEAWVTTLCVECHQKLHPGHGVGKSENDALFNVLKEKYIRLSRNPSKTRKAIAEELGISYTTAYLWDRKLGFERPFRTSKRKGLKTINVTFEDSEVEVLERVKGKIPWRKFIVDCVDIVEKYLKENTKIKL